uniref:LysR transcriptional regulator n=1 Tax=Trachydiscus minutus TaxID=1032745 RepID=A0A0D3M5S5_9STRA|nr:LysR family transcriptional regulator [Trachydiscus minutus]AIB04128.1 LysR transcriptional regulator [Trachydiscus minutus]
MLKTKNLLINSNFNSTIILNNYQFTPKLRRHIYYINKYKTLNVEEKKNFINLNIKQLNFDLLTIFYTVVTLGSLSKAAKRLALTQPAISLALRRIEKEMGFLVFRQVNSKTSLLLSPAGLILFNYIERFFQILEESEKLANINHPQYPLIRSYAIDLKGSNLLTVIKKNKPLCSFLKSPLINLLSKKDLLQTTKFSLIYFHNKSKFIILNKEFNVSSKIFKLNYKNSLRRYIIFNKIFSFKVLNKSIYVTLKQTNFVELHTTNAYLIALDMKISNSLYWGSEI